MFAGRPKSAPDLWSLGPDFGYLWEQFGPDLLQFYEGYFYYKYRLCIRANLEIEGAETRV